MSSTYGVMARRWAAKSMRLVRWFKREGQQCDHGEPLCEIDIDGHLVTIPYVYDDPPKTIGIYWTYVDEGDEVGPWGTLIAHSSDGGLIRPPLHYDPRGRRFRYSRRDRYPRIFLNYRRADTEAYAGRLHERLTAEFGADEIFMDLFSIRPGEIFSCTVQQAAAHCDVMIALVGTSWPKIADATGRRKLDRESDFVRREITAAMDRQIPLLPVLAPGGAIPQFTDLPEEMRGFEEIQMHSLTPRHWVSDVDLLVEQIRRALPARPGDAPVNAARV